MVWTLALKKCLNLAVSSIELAEKDCNLSLVGIVGENGGPQLHACPCHGSD